MNRLLILTLLILIAGCSDYQLHSNVDKENFETYFKPSKVTVYNKDQLLDLEYTVLGAVEGSSCQIDEIDLPASESEARTEARINAADMNANGVIFQSCINFERDESCVSNVICYGRALDVEEPTNG
ncbi:Rcs stress response system protein RcsF [Psychromonas sp. GE-S-Ul-11]|uniref:Rcs stress response system protein RcsF n=1 Tax=Psychromonas sp. GE-S-Ul-11 TaxID=3241170 RepID=UPI00390C7F4B